MTTADHSRLAERIDHARLDDLVAVGRTGPGWARVWLRAATPGELEVRWQPAVGPGPGGRARVMVPADDPADGTRSLRLPDADPAAAALAPDRAYVVLLVRRPGDRVVAAARFHSAPDPHRPGPERFAVGLLSCHHPFADDGSVRPDATAMLAAATTALAERDTRLVIMLGDQMYADYPPAASLFDKRFFAGRAPPGRRSILDCTAGEVRRLYQERYRCFLAPEGWRALLAAGASCAILDDHELVNNFGSHPDHAGPRYDALRRGALQAYVDYQGSRARDPAAPAPRSFHFRFEHGPLAGFVADLRSRRRTEPGRGRLLGEEQLADLERFLRDHRDRPVLLLAFSVPLVHVHRLVARLGRRLTPDGDEFSDRWTNAAYDHDRDRVLRLLWAHQQAHPHQVLVLVSGDIHVASALELRWQDGGPRAWQFVSSAVTHRAPLHVKLVSRLTLRTTFRVGTADHALGWNARLLDADGRGANPYAGLNVGFVEIDGSKDRDRPAVRLVLVGERGGRPLVRYRSPPLVP